MQKKQILTATLLSSILVGGALIGSKTSLMPLGLTAAHAAGYGGRPSRTPLTAAQNQAIYAAILKRDNAIVAADQAYVTAETAVYAGTTANTGTQELTTVQRQALDTAVKTLDTATRAAQKLYDQTVAQILAGTSTTGQTGVAVSSAEASVKNSLVDLHFAGPLDPTSAQTVGNYSVTVNGTAITVESATYYNSHTVTLGLATGALKSGDAVVVTWTGLKDIHGNAVAGNISATAK